MNKLTERTVSIEYTCPTSQAIHRVINSNSQQHTPPVNIPRRIPNVHLSLQPIILPRHKINYALNYLSLLRAFQDASRPELFVGFDAFDVVS